MFNLEDELKKETQKSYMFLWPLLNLPTNIKPINTYLGFKDANTDKPLIIGMFHKDLFNYKQQKRILVQNKNYQVYFIDEGFEYFVFELKDYKHDYTLIINGMYSDVSQRTKNRIIGSSVHKMTGLALYPDDIRNEIADLFNVKEGPKEILGPPNFETELISASERMIKLFKGCFIKTCEILV